MTNKILPLIMVVLLSAFAAFSQTTEFTYQGSLTVSGSPANGNYDFEFALYDSLIVGTQLGSTQTRNGVAVVNGIFAVKLDFGNQFPGANRFLEIRVRPSGQPGITVLAPRQSLGSHPYSVKSLAADNATTSNNALSLGGVVAGQYVLTADARLSDARNPLPGSASYIQNQVVEAQPSTNFNISGTGVANYLRANTAYFLNSDRVLSSGGTANLFVGVNAGFGNPSGDSNTFVGSAAGYTNSTGARNSFFGSNAGRSSATAISNSFFGANAGYNSTGNLNAFFGAYAGTATTTGSQNSFFGSFAGSGNISGTMDSFFGTQAGNGNNAGSENAFFGYWAGYNNTGGHRNSFLGAFSGQSNTSESNNTFVGAYTEGLAGITNAAAIGYQAQVTQSNSLVLGSIDGVNRASANTNVGIGTTAPSNRLKVVASLSGVATPTGHVALIENSSTGTSPDVLALKIGRATDPDSSNNFITFFRGDDTSVGSIQGNGSGGIVLGGPGSDYAEWLPRLDPNEKIEPGDIVGVFNGRVSRSTAGASQVMAVSTGAIVAGNDPGEKRRETHTLTAFIGQAMINVIGAVRAGDLIIPSGLEDGSGIAVSSENISAAQFGQAVGQAWESSDDTGLKKIRVAVGLIRGDPNIKSLFERSRTQEVKIRSLQRQVNELKKLVCSWNTRSEVCKEQ